ncbi:DUF4271 domain-containing protein [Nonlabens sp. Asnod2-A12]|uniref:DUF4271 domain-containing protein n=1 Tax=Nonlabens sp. Asnod2-A12 TaxID=3160578 RepID=UPI00386D2706
MNFELRHISPNDWITITLLICIVILAIAKWFSSIPLGDLLSSYFKDRFIKISKSNGESTSLLLISSQVVYGISLSLFVYLFYQSRIASPPQFINFILALTFIVTFLLGKHYLGKLIANLCHFEEIVEVIDHHRNINRSIFSFGLLLINFIVIYAFHMEQIPFLIAFIIVALFLFTYNIILIYTYRALLISAPFYFILYLCALEIAPYLLLYKYIML